MRYEGESCNGGFFTRFKDMKMGCLKSMNVEWKNTKI